MAHDAKTRFLDGLRVTAEHLNHMQERLLEAIVDVRRTLGLGQIAWGLRARLEGSQVVLEPGLGFSTSGLRLALEQAVTLTLGEGAGPFQVVLRVQNGDREALRLGTEPTVLLASTLASVEAISDLDLDALAIAHIADGALTQSETLFIARGSHGHSGGFIQDAAGRWHFDGVPVEGSSSSGGVGPAGPPGPAGEAGAQGPVGDAGAQGPPGETGERGEAGPPGPPGETGQRGEAGPAGEPGQRGEGGAAGEPGQRGEAGPTGEAGSQGPPGPPGERGASGEPGPPGLQGPTGQTGQTGAQGPPGPAGTGERFDYPFIARVSWPHAKTASFSTMQLPLQLAATFSEPLHDDVIRAQPSVVEAFFDPFRSGRVGSTFSLHGKLSLSPNDLRWDCTDDPELVRALLDVAGRFSIRIHCSDLYAADRRVVSNCLSAITPGNALPIPRLPGGVFESWFLWTTANG